MGKGERNGGRGEGRRGKQQKQKRHKEREIQAGGGCRRTRGSLPMNVGFVEERQRRKASLSSAEGTEGKKEEMVGRIGKRTLERKCERGGGGKVVCRVGG